LVSRWPAILLFMAHGAMFPAAHATEQPAADKESDTALSSAC